MAAVTLSFSKVGSLWQTTTDSLGHMVLQTKLKGKGDITIEQYIEGMEPTPLSSHKIDDINVIIPFKAVRGLKIKITSTSEVEKAMLMEAVYDKPSGSGAIPENILTESDIVNNLTSTETTKALSAAQGKALKELIPTGVLKTTDIINNLTSTDTDKPLSAAQGKALKELIPTGTVLKTTDIVNNLTSTETTKALSAAQGKALKELIPTAATTEKAGLVRQMNLVADPSEDTIQALKTTVISILRELKTALVMKNQ